MTKTTVTIVFNFEDIEPELLDNAVCAELYDLMRTSDVKYWAEITTETK